MHMKMMECAPQAEAVHEVAWQKFRPIKSKQSIYTVAVRIPRVKNIAPHLVSPADYVAH